MKELSVFDIIGPNMIGPSSSHTAGALRIALLAKKMNKAHIKKVIFTLYGSFARTYKGHGTDKALVGGIMGFSTEDYRIKDSFEYAKESGLEYQFVLDFEKKDLHPNTADIDMIDDQGRHFLVRGESIGGGAAVIKRINGVDVDLTGEYNTILIKQKDEKGVLAYITKCLSDFDINIAFTKLYRENKGEIAYTIIEADQQIPAAVVDQIEEFKYIMNATLIEV